MGYCFECDVGDCVYHLRLHCEAVEAEVKELEAERDELKRRLDKAEHALKSCYCYDKRMFET